MTDQILHDLSLLSPEVALTATLLVAILVDLIFRRRSLVTAAAVLIGLIVTGVMVLNQAGTHASVFSNMIAVDPFAWYFKIVIVLSTIIIIVFSLGSAELNSPGRRLGEYYALLVALTLGSVLMAGASNLLMMYLALELSSLSSYVLSGYTKEAPDSSEASLKYVIYGALSSGLMLYGISILYGLTGSVDLYTVNKVLPQIVSQGGTHLFLVVIATILALAGFGYKISAVPFHFWAPDVYEGAPIPITAYLSVASKAGGFAMLIRFLKVGFIDQSGAPLPEGLWATFQAFPWFGLIAVLSVITMTIGNLIAIWQDNLKRLLAYSSIAHAGYMMMGIVVLGNDGLAAIMLYFVIYLFMNLGAFYVVMLVANKTGSEDIHEYRGLGTRSPFIAVALAIFLVSLTGLPPTAGFIGKLYLFSALINHGWVWLAIVGALNSVIAVYYYIRVIRNMFLSFDDSHHPAMVFPVQQTLTVLVLLVPTLLLGIYFSPLVQLAQGSVAIFGTP